MRTSLRTQRKVAQSPCRLLVHSLHVANQHRMLVRITSRPPVSYDLSDDSLRIGRVYDLPSEFASALIIDGCAEFADSDSSKSRHLDRAGFTSATVHDRPAVFRKQKPH